MNKIIPDKSASKFVIISSILFIGIFIIENINGRFWLNDFKVFYLAAKALLQNEQVYGIAFGLETGFYKYSPFTLLFFLPLTFLPFQSAAIVDFFINSICAIATILLLVKIISQYLIPNQKTKLFVLLAILVCVINHLFRELHLGNTNMLLLLLLCLSLKFSLESKPILSGIFLAIVILTKPYFLICILPFLLSNKRKTIFSFILSTIAFISLTFVVSGFENGLTLYSEWILAMKEHSVYLTSAQTISSLLNFYFGITIPSSINIILLGIISLLLFAYFFILSLRKSNNNISAIDKNKLLIIYFFMQIAFVPSILITDTEHFLFSLPLIVILILFLAKNKNYLLISLFIIVIFMYGGNSSDLLGKSLAAQFENYGLLGISNLILIISVLLFFSGSKKSYFFEENISV